MKLQTRSMQWEIQLQRNLEWCRIRLIIVEKLNTQMETGERKLKTEMKRLRQQIARTSKDLSKIIGSQ